MFMHLAVLRKQLRVSAIVMIFFSDDFLLSITYSTLMFSVVLYPYVW